LHWLWDRTQGWPSRHASAGARAAGLLLAIGLSAFGVFIAATLAFFAALLVVGFIVAVLIFILVWSLGFSSEEKAGPASDGQSTPSSRSEPDLEDIIEKLKSGTYKIEDDGAIVSTGLFGGSTGYKIDADTGEILKTGGLFAEPTGYKIDVDSGEVVKRGWLTDESTGYKIDQESGEVLKREWLTDSSTGLRIDRRTGKIEKEGCFLTTACLRVRGLPDNCAELQELREFRDEYVRKRADGEEILREYYSLAPMVVSCIDRSSESSQIYEALYERFVERSLELIRAGRNEEALCYYRSEFAKLRIQLRLDCDGDVQLGVANGSGSHRVLEQK
ncbi:MAG: CFI-box-CTERM domain-containing protein, partial [Desulfomonilaceae bacterium]